MTTPASPAITLRQPSTSPTPTSTPIPPPPLSRLLGNWNVTHSTLPMWRKARNVRITYTALATRTRGVVDLDDEVSYQAVDKMSAKVKRVRGVDRASTLASTTSTSAPIPAGPNDVVDAKVDENASLAYTWRGRGLLLIATSKWEILGWGSESAMGNEWVVTYFAKTLFTPAGIDIYARRGQLQGETVGEIKKALEGLGGEMAKLAGGMFEVAFDGEREAQA